MALLTASTMRSRVPLLAAGVLYVAGVLAAGAASPWVELLLAAAAFGALLLAWREPASAVQAPGLLSLPAWLIIGAGLPLHLLILATGSLASPLLPLAGVWVGLVGLAGVREAGLAAIAALVLVPAAAVLHAIPPATGLIELIVVVLAGYGLARVLRQRPPATPPVGTTSPGWRPDLPASWPGQEAAMHRGLDELRAILERAQLAAGAERAVIWDADVDADRGRPALAVGGPLPNAIVWTGDPLRWAWEESIAMRLERPPGWALDGRGACVLPLTPGAREAALLTFEFPADSPLPATESMAAHATLIQLAIGALVRERTAVQDRERLEQVLEMLRALPGRIAGESFAPSLAEAARQLMGGSGALLARWKDDQGRIVAVVGEDGGPVVGAAFGAAESELALAARGGTTLRRDALRPGHRSVPIGAPGERWHREPRALVVVPLADPSEGVTGVLAIWTSTDTELDSTNLEALRSVAPYAAIQLRYALDYENVVERARRDPLTGLFNRRAFEERMTADTAHFHRYRRPLSLIVLDLDHFKRVNDTLGHEAGDTVLRAVAQEMLGSVRETDVVARYGGEEFVVIMPEIGLAEAVEAAERLRRSIERLEIPWQGRPIPVRASIGVSSCLACVEDPADLLGSADSALYQAKADGRNRVTRAPDAQAV